MIIKVNGTLYAIYGGNYYSGGKQYNFINGEMVEV